MTEKPNKKPDRPPRAIDRMSPDARAAFEESWKANQGAMRRLAKL